MAHKNKKKENPQILGLGPKIINSIKIALEENDHIHILRLVEGLDEYDVAKLIESLHKSERTKFLEIMGDKISPDVYVELNDTLQEQLIDDMEQDRLVDIVNELDSDEAVEILEHLDENEQKDIIKQLDDAELKGQIRASLNYPEDSAGRIMSREFVSMPHYWSVKEAKNFLLKDKDLPEDFYTIFIINEKFKPIGEISLDKLLRAKSSQLLSDVMDEEITPISVNTDQEELALMFREYDWVSAAVVDNKGHLIGIIDVDDIIDVVHEEAVEDIMHLSGVESGDVYKSVPQIFKSRIIWLIINLIASVLAASVVSGFENVIVAITTVAILMPVVISMAGSTGQQTLAVVVRAIATKELNNSNTWRMIGKEILVGFSNGLFFAIIAFIATMLLFPEEPNISLVIALALVCNLTIGSLGGILIPITLNKLKIDPAVSSGIFLFALTDSGGLLVFLSLAKLILL
ncbi:MAG: magnesium transporter [Alphaproteobacteria bacterium]